MVTEMRVKKFLQNLRSFDKMLSVKKEVVFDRKIIFYFRCQREKLRVILGGKI